MAGRLQPALWGGLFIGVLSALPLVKYGNACCCLWVVLGGVLAVWLAQSNDPNPVRTSDAVLLGLLAGAIGAVVAFPINLALADMERGWILRMLQNLNAEIPPELTSMLENDQTNALVATGGLVLSIVVNAIFGLLGALLGLAIFRKNAPPPPPPGTIEVLPPQ